MVAYREQTFSLLMTNAWEVLLKARLVQQSGGKENVIYRRKQGSRQIRRVPGSKEPMTISLREALHHVALPNLVKANILGLEVIRNRSAHLGVLGPDLRERVLEFGTAGVQNFIKLIAEWFGESVDVPYLLPVGFIGQATLTKGTYPKAQLDLLKSLNDIAISSSGGDESGYSVYMQVRIELNRGLSGGGNIGLTNAPDAPKVSISDDEALKTFSASYNELVEKCRHRYVGFKQNQQFHSAMKAVNDTPQCTYERKLDPKTEKSSKKRFYNLEQALVKLDQEYAKAHQAQRVQLI